MTSKKPKWTFAEACALLGNTCQLTTGVMFESRRSYSIVEWFGEGDMFVAQGLFYGDLRFVMVFQDSGHCLTVFKGDRANRLRSAGVKKEEF